jgi:hypothetical protein
MFETANSGPWRSVHKQDGAHYNTYACENKDGMDALREFFVGGANSMNVCVFSTSGVHGTYSTIEYAEMCLVNGCKDEDDNAITPQVTFLVIQPRICCVRYGNCEPKTTDDIAFLKTLRQQSWDALLTIGRLE